jgi:hypothetical protein
LPAWIYSGKQTIQFDFLRAHPPGREGDQAPPLNLAIVSKQGHLPVYEAPDHDVTFRPDAEKPWGFPNDMTRELNLTEKLSKTQKALDRRFCVAPMMDSEAWQKKALCFWSLGQGHPKGVVLFVVPPDQNFRLLVCRR